MALGGSALGGPCCSLCLSGYISFNPLVPVETKIERCSPKDRAFIPRNSGKLGPERLWETDKKKERNTGGGQEIISDISGGSVDTTACISFPAVNLRSHWPLDARDTGFARRRRSGFFTQRNSEERYGRGSALGILYRILFPSSGSFTFGHCSSLLKCYLSLLCRGLQAWSGVEMGNWWQNKLLLHKLVFRCFFRSAAGLFIWCLVFIISYSLCCGIPVVMVFFFRPGAWSISLIP